MVAMVVRKILGATDLKVGMHIQLHSVSNMGSVPPGHTSSFSCERLKNAKNGISAKTLEPKELDHDLIYIWNKYNLGNVLSTLYDHTHFYVHVKPQKKPKMVFGHKNPWSDKLKTWYAYTN